MFLGRGLIDPHQRIGRPIQGGSTRSDPFGGAYDLNRKHLPKDILPYQGRLCQGRLQKRENRSRFLKGTRRVRRAPRSSAALVQVPSLYKYVFSWKINAFPEIFSIFLIFFAVRIALQKGGGAKSLFLHFFTLCGQIFVFLLQKGTGLCYNKG